MITTQFDYGMFSDAGNAAVHKIVLHAVSKNLEWSDVYIMLLGLSTISGHPEANDTVVRERVYSRLKFNTPFYI